MQDQKPRVRIRPFDLRKHEEAFSVSPQGIPGVREQDNYETTSTDIRISTTRMSLSKSRPKRGRTARKRSSSASFRTRTAPSRHLPPKCPPLPRLSTPGRLALACSPGKVWRSRRRLLIRAWEHRVRAPLCGAPCPPRRRRRRTRKLGGERPPSHPRPTPRPAAKSASATMLRRRR